MGVVDRRGIWLEPQDALKRQKEIAAMSWVSLAVCHAVQDKYSRIEQRKTRKRQSCYCTLELETRWDRLERWSILQ